MLSKLSHSKKNLIRIVISFIIAIVGIQLISLNQRAEQKLEEVKYLAAANEFDVGHEIKESDLIEVTTKEKPGFTYTNDKDELVGKILKYKVFPKEALFSKKVDKKEDFKQATKKRYSLKVQPENAVAGTIRAGDRVKIIGTSVNAANSDSEYILSLNNKPVSLDVIDVYDMNGNKITDEKTPAILYVLELTEDQVTVLDKAASTKNLKLIKDTQ